MKTRIFNPLKADHPLVKDGDSCPLCKRPFFEGERTVLAAARTPLEGFENVPAVPLHARCALEGMKTAKGTIKHVKDGDGSPYPIVTEQGQFKAEELDLD